MKYPQYFSMTHSIHNTSEYFDHRQQGKFSSLWGLRNNDAKY
ncbi:MAG: hypothetical protein WCL18_10175 [bacterium]